jgi:hypothetical protein
VPTKQRVAARDSSARPTLYSSAQPLDGLGAASQPEQHARRALVGPCGLPRVADGAEGSPGDTQSVQVLITAPQLLQSNGTPQRAPTEIVLAAVQSREESLCHVPRL